jgi:hypothetical protein
LVHEEGVILLGELEPFPKENSLLPKEVFFIRELGFFPSGEGAFFLMGLGPFLGKIHCSLGKLSFSPNLFFYLTGNLFETSI